MPILPSHYRAPLWLRNAHVNTIWSSKGRRMDFPDAAQAARCHRVRLDTPDGDFLDVDVHAPAPGLPERGVAILSHGLEGHSQRKYIRGLARVLLEEGFRVLAWNMRGCSGEPNRTDRLYHMGVTEDLAHPAGRHAEGRQGRGVFHQTMSQGLGQAEAAACGAALRPGRAAQGQHQPTAAPEPLRGHDLEALAIGQGTHGAHLGLAVKAAALTAAVLHQGLQQASGRDREEELAVGAFFHRQAPGADHPLHILRCEGIQRGLAEGGIIAGIVVGRQTAVGEIGLAAAADAELAAGGGGAFQQGHVQTVGRGLTGAHEARRARAQDEHVGIQGGGV